MSNNPRGCSYSTATGGYSMGGQSAFHPPSAYSPPPLQYGYNAPVYNTYNPNTEPFMQHGLSAPVMGSPGSAQPYQTPSMQSTVPNYGAYGAPAAPSQPRVGMTSQELDTALSKFGGKPPPSRTHPSSNHSKSQKRYEVKKKVAAVEIGEILTERGIYERSGPSQTAAFIRLFLEIEEENERLKEKLATRQGR